MTAAAVEPTGPEHERQRVTRRRRSARSRSTTRSSKILDALRSNGYKPALRIEDIEVHAGGPM